MCVYDQLPNSELRSECGEIHFTIPGPSPIPPPTPPPLLPAREANGSAVVRRNRADSPSGSPHPEASSGFGLFNEHPFGFAMNFCKIRPQTEVWWSFPSSLPIRGAPSSIRCPAQLSVGHPPLLFSSAGIAVSSGIFFLPDEGSTPSKQAFEPAINMYKSAS